MAERHGKEKTIKVVIALGGNALQEGRGGYGGGPACRRSKDL